MIDIQQCALGALEQDSLAVAPFAVQQRPNRIHVGQDTRRDRGEYIINRFGFDLGKIHPAPQRIVVGEQPINLGAED